VRTHRPGRAAAIARSALALSVAGVLAGTFLPWVVSGRVRRSVYQLAGTADRLGVAGSLPLGLAFLIPLLVAVPALLLVLGRGRAAGVCGIAVALIVGAGGVAALVADPDGLVTIAALGPAVTTISAVSLLVAALGTIRWAPTGTAQGEGADR
jgi:hypothetical protein